MALETGYLLLRRSAVAIETSVGVDEATVWLQVPIDVWSLETLDTPIYPQSCFQLGVARHLVSEINYEFQIRITIFGTTDRLTGQCKSLT